MKQAGREALVTAAFAIAMGGEGSASPAPFRKSPREFDALANKALKQVDSDLRFKLEACSGSDSLECRFSSDHVAVLVQGRSNPPRTGRIVLEADLLQDRPGADAVAAITDTVLSLGATVVSFDPGLPAEKRVELISELTNDALDKGQSEASGQDATYAATFDRQTDGRIAITVTPKE
ncbi:hypothetical protein [Microvirga roseola]|uniref:hypothetical protein n=1 Tax=Microvirga roseola TaxID=2883126 RepID=UPI001E4ED1AD|nr:hypothetical protein [Microvirga roseola]